MRNTDQLWTVVIVLSIISCAKINTVFANSDGDEINNVEPSTTSIPSEIAKNNEDSVINLNATDQHKLLQINEALSHRVMALENRVGRQNMTCILISKHIYILNMDIFIIIRARQ